MKKNIGCFLPGKEGFLKGTLRVAAAALLIMTGMKFAAFADPAVSQKTDIYVSKQYDAKKQEMAYGTSGAIILKGVNRNAVITALNSSNPRINLFEEYGTLPTGKKGWQVFVNSEPQADLSLADFNVSIGVKQGGKTYQLSTGCSYSSYKPFKSVRINGKNVLNQFKPGYDTAELKLAGKKLKISCKTKKGFRYGSFMVQRNGRSMKKILLRKE